MKKNLVIDVKSLFKSFEVGDQTIPVLKDINFQVEEGDYLIIFGPSGCGKSTLLHTILGLEPPTQGQVKILDEDLYKNTDEDDRSDFRKKHIGMVYQQSNWIKSLNVIKNITFPLKLLGFSKDLAEERAREFLKQVNMLEWENYIPTELSSGQQQRISLARALVAKPEIIIADEPTGNLDYEAGQKLMSLLNHLNQKLGKTIIMVTHDLEYLTYAKTIVNLFDGKVKNVYKGEDRKKIISTIKTKKGFFADIDKE